MARSRTDAGARITFQTADVMSADFMPESFDVVISVNLLHRFSTASCARRIVRR